MIRRMNIARRIRRSVSNAGDAAANLAATVIHAMCSIDTSRGVASSGISMEVRREMAEEHEAHPRARKR